MAIALKQRKHLAPRTVSRLRRQVRGRKKISGTAERPRLVVTRSTRHIVAQVVNDLDGRTVASASSMEVDLRGAEGDKTAKAKRVGEPSAPGGIMPRDGFERLYERVDS